MKSNQTSVSLNTKLLNFITEIAKLWHGDPIPLEKKYFVALAKAISSFVDTQTSPNLLENLQIVHGTLKNKPSSAEITNLITTCEELILDIEALRIKPEDQEELINARIAQAIELHFKAQQLWMEEQALEKEIKENENYLSEMRVDINRARQEWINAAEELHNAYEREQQIIQAPQNFLSWVAHQAAEKATRAKEAITNCSIF